MSPQVESLIVMNLRQIIIWPDIEQEEIRLFCDRVDIYKKENDYFWVEVYDNDKKISILEIDSLKKKDYEYIKKDGVMVVEDDWIRFRHCKIALYPQD